MSRVNLPHTVRIRAKGRDYWYFRRGDQRIRLPGAPGSTAFLKRYTSLIETADHLPTAWPDHTIGALIAAYKTSPEFAALTRETKGDYLRALDRLAVLAAFPVSDLRRRHVLAIRDKHAATPRTADYTVAVISRVMAWAVEREWIAANPATRVPKINRAESYAPWPPGAIARFIAANPAGPARMAFELARFTGQRRGDVLRMSPADWHVVAGRPVLCLTQSKTGAELDIPVHPALAAYIAENAAQRGPYVQRDGRPLTPSVFDKAFGRAMAEAGLSGLVFHGLRHTAATALADAGCSDAEIASITGHASPQMVKRYTKRRDQRRLAERAMATMQAGECKTG